MASRAERRRAAPPRPTLLVGDLQACREAFERLEQRVLELELKEQASIAEGAPPPVQRRDGVTVGVTWQDLVARCRSLRETLTSLHELSHFTRQVYEVAADVCVRAGDYPEALKCISSLQRFIYPALASQLASNGSAAGSGGAGAAGAAEWMAGQEAGADDEEGGVPSSAAPVVADAAVEAALAHPAFRRWPEVAASAVLYFRCCGLAGGGGHGFDTLASLSRLPRRLLASAEVQLALGVLAALASGDFVTFFRLQAAAPPLVRRLMQAPAAGVREGALACLGAAYRNIAVGAVARMLALQAAGPPAAAHALLACLKTLAERGSLPARRALEEAQSCDAAVPDTLVFKG